MVFTSLSKCFWEILLYWAGNYCIANSNCFATNLVQLSIHKLDGNVGPDYFHRMCIDHILL